MSDGTAEGPVAGRVGFWSAVGLFIIGFSYAVVTGAGIVQFGAEPISDPILGVMEVLTLLAAPLIVVMMAALYRCSPPAMSAFTLIALVFAGLMAGITSGVHFVELTAGRQMGISSLQWPSIPYALELLAWDVFLGMSLLFAAPTLHVLGNQATVRVVVVTGVLCLLGTIGPLVGDMRWQVIGIVGYGLALPVAALMIAGVFRRLGNSE